MSLLSTLEIQNFTGEAIKLFDFASQFHSIVVIKDPIKTIIEEDNQNEYAGYGNSSNVENYTLTPVSGQFRCVVVSPQKDYKDEIFDPANIPLTKGSKIIKVEESAKNYIENGKTLQIILDNTENFNIISSALVRNYGGLQYYCFSLEKTT